jgi:K(+)-stimulated pyrophosphate-energized sodium pump
MANAGGAWDNRQEDRRGRAARERHRPARGDVVGDTVGDPFKDTSSVAMNPIIKFATLFGLLAVELAIEMPPQLKLVLAGVFFGIALIFVYRSFYGMRIHSGEHVAEEPSSGEAHTTHISAADRTPAKVAS